MCSETQKPKRRWFRYSLRTMLVLVTLVAIVLGRWTFQARHQQRVVDQILALNGEVYYDYQYPNGRFVPDAPPPVPRWLYDAVGAHYFVRVTNVKQFGHFIAAISAGNKLRHAPIQCTSYC
jgi:hypothetical protein